MQQIIDAPVNAINSPGLQLDRERGLQTLDPSLQHLNSHFQSGTIPEDSVCAC